MALMSLLLWAVLSGCQQHASTSPPEDPARLRSQESDELSLWITGGVYPSDSVSARIYEELDTIRMKYSAAEPFLAPVHFTPPWPRNRLVLWLEESLYDSLRSGVHTSLDSLLTAHDAFPADYFDGFGLYSAVVAFGRTTNPVPLLTTYVQTPGVRRACTDLSAGDWSNVYASLEPERSRYLFFAGGGDCWSGCTEQVYWYFRVTPERLEYVGKYDPGHDSVVPTWVEEALELRQQYRRAGMWCSSRLTSR